MIMPHGQRSYTPLLLRTRMMAMIAARIMLKDNVSMMVVVVVMTSNGQAFAGKTVCDGMFDKDLEQAVPTS